MKQQYTVIYKDSEGRQRDMSFIETTHEDARNRAEKFLELHRPESNITNIKGKKD